MATIRSINVGKAIASEHTDVGVTGIDKRRAAGAVYVRDPEPGGGSALVGDAVCDTRFHGGRDKAVYAYAGEDLDWWSADLSRDLSDGFFGENLTTSGLDVTGAVVGERWRIGASVVLEVTEPRLPCRTFAAHVGEPRWIKTFTARAAPGAYLRVVERGWIRAGDGVEVVDRPEHGVTVGTAFRALTVEPALLSRLLEVDSLKDRVAGRLRGPGAVRRSRGGRPRPEPGP